jgi:hypothetical protein
VGEHRYNDEFFAPVAIVVPIVVSPDALIGFETELVDAALTAVGAVIVAMGVVAAVGFADVAGVDAVIRVDASDETTTLMLGIAVAPGTVVDETALLALLCKLFGLELGEEAAKVLTLCEMAMAGVVDPG